MSWTWQGRQLTKAVKDKTVTYTYDSEGIRTSKSDGTNTTKYLLNGTQILAQTTNGKTLCFFYDQQGNRVGMADSSNHFYYYIYNVQGDVIALADASTGKLAVTYTYDAWGKLVELKDNTANSVGTQNPFRYRGYYYDTETSLYYLQSRYYDPEVGRFINADAFTSTDISSPISTNMFAYCENNPVMRDDHSGEIWTQFAFGIASQYVGDVIGNIIGGKSGWDILKPTSSIGEYVASGVSAMIPGTKLISSIARSAVSTAITSGEKLVKTGKIDTLQMAESFGKNLLFDVGASKISNYVEKKVREKMPRNYSSYAHIQRQKNASLTKPEIESLMQRTQRIGDRVKKTADFFISSIFSAF
mgnify:CR=1 FL=1